MGPGKLDTSQSTPFICLLQLWTTHESVQTFKKAVEEGLELLARRNGSEPNLDVSVWDALDPDDPRNQEAGEAGEEGADEDAGLGRDIRPQVGWS